MKDKRNHHGAADKPSSEQQFRKSPLLRGISGAVHLALVGLVAGWLAGRQNPGKFQNFKNLLQIEMLGFSLRLTKVQHYYSSTNAFKLVFSAKAYCKVIFRSMKIRKPYIFIGIPTIKYYRT